MGLVATTLGPRLMAADRGQPELRVEPGLRLRGDPDMLALALDCLAGNALAHGAGAVRLEAARRDEGLRLTVEDDGPGVAPPRRQAVQAAFAVGAPVHTRAADGLGLGLPLTRRLVELHGGELSLEGGDGRPFRAAPTLPRWRVVS